MVVCQYFLRGQCKFGDGCRNEHPRQGGGGGFGNSTWVNPSRNTEKPVVSFSADSMTKDLTPQVDKPMWPLSSYGPAKLEPTLIGGLDESQEELRVRAVMAMQAGNANEYMTYEAGKISAAEAVFNNARANIQQAYQAATKQSPSASLLSSATTSSFGKPNPLGAASSSPFGGPKSAFGQPTFGQTGFGTTSSPFGQQPSTSMTTGAFGQPIQQPTSAFGAPPQPSQPQASIIKPATGAFSSFASGPSAFGANTTGNTGGGFSAFSGQPSAFGAPPTTTGGGTFGQPSFGAPSAFGALSQQSQQTQSPFGTFGQPAAQPQPQPVTSVFGTPAFGAPPAQQAQPFGSTTTQPTPASGFSAFASSSTSSFTQPTQQANTGLSAFASSSPASTVPGKNPHCGPPNFDAIVEMGLQCLSGAATGTAQSTPLFKPRSTPYDGNIPPNYVDIIPQTMIQAFRDKKFEWGNIPECVPPLQLR